MEELTARLDRLEWANRRLSWLVSAAMVGVVLLGLLDFVAPKSSSVEGRRFIVKDETDVSGQSLVTLIGLLAVATWRKRPTVKRSYGLFLYDEGGQPARGLGHDS